MELTKIPYASHEEWLKIRKNYIGGSDAGAVMGMNPYKSPFALWAEKTGAAPAFEGNVTTEVGSFLEQLVADMFERETGKKVRKCNYTLINSDYPFACANVDRMIVGEDAILECKTTNSFVNVKKFRNGEYPEQWYCQMMHYLAVTGKKKAYFAVISECRDFRVFEMERDEAEIDALMSAERDFMEKVQSNTPPSPDGAESTTDAISGMYPESREGLADLGGTEAAGLLEQRAQLKGMIKQLDEQVAQIENSIKLKIGEAEKAVAGKYSITWKTQERASFDKEAFKKAMPGVDMDPFMKKSSSRVLRITERKAGA